MTNRAGTMNNNLVWAFAFGALALGTGGAYLTSGLGSTISSAVYFGVFLVGGYMATFLTQSKTWVAGIAFFLASLISAGAYFAIAAYATSAATEAVGGGEVASTFGALVGIFVAIITLLVSLSAGIGGCVAGAKMRAKVAHV